MLVEVGTTHCEKHAASEKRDRDRPADRKRGAEPWRKWYKRAAWKGPNGRRARQLKAEPLCALCPDHSKRAATIADYITPHRGDYSLFWFGPLQSLCKSCHDIKKQREESRPRGGSKVHTHAVGD
ncbi:MAG TPA: hypothetical protein DIT40_08980, partial [Alphaproteobacteria bacterium]|nr:hypothetical protein [Alphaproteobacteria bacterium]